METKDKKQLTHHVFFWLKNRDSKEDLAKLLDGLRTLKKIETIRKLHIGGERNVEQIDSAGLRWVNVERPGALERAWLEENFEFHALDLEDVLSRNQRPKIDVYDDYLFIVLHFPVFDSAARRLACIPRH